MVGFQFTGNGGAQTREDWPFGVATEEDYRNS